MCELTIDNIGQNFHVSMRMLSKATVRLNEVIVHDSKNSKFAVLGVAGVNRANDDKTKRGCCLLVSRSSYYYGVFVERSEHKTYRYSAKEKWKRLLSQFLLLQEGSSLGLDGFPNQIGDGSET